MSSHRAPSYDEVPFPGLPIFASQPERLAAIGRLRGMQPRAAAAARVLELGCAAGQNLLPLAERYPQASFLGIDQSPRQIETARQAADDAGLTNIEFRVQDIATLGDEVGTFDYILAHAVYSWVDLPTRDKLLAICQRNLAPHGLAYVSYNTYPGWQVHDMLRAAMLYDARGARTPAEQVGRARQLLGFLESSLVEETPYNELVKTEVAQVLRQSDGYLLHDHLETINQSVYFRQFVAHAREHRLQIAGDGVLGIRTQDRLDPASEHELSLLTSDPVEQEQYRDIVRNRAIRQSVLCRGDVALSDHSTVESFRGLYLDSSVRPEGEVIVDSEEVSRFGTYGGLRISSGVPVIKAALLHLGSRWPDYITFDELVAQALERTAASAAGQGASRENDTKRLEDNLRLCCFGGVIDVHSEPPGFTVHVSERPKADALARRQAAEGEVATNRKHEAVRLEAVDRQVLPLLDGNRDQAALVDALASAAAQGRFAVYEHQQLLQDPAQSRRVLSELLPRSLEQLARSGFLIG